MNAVEVQRCLYPNDKNIVRTEWHGFRDASNEAHATIIYLHYEYANGEIVVWQIHVATKLALKQTIAIPKLELNSYLKVARFA